MYSEKNVHILLVVAWVFTMCSHNKPKKYYITAGYMHSFYLWPLYWRKHVHVYMYCISKMVWLSPNQMGQGMSFSRDTCYSDNDLNEDCSFWQGKSPQWITTTKKQIAQGVLTICIKSKKETWLQVHFKPFFHLFYLCCLFAQKAQMFISLLSVLIIHLHFYLLFFVPFNIKYESVDVDSVE